MLSVWASALTVVESGLAIFQNIRSKTLEPSNFRAEIIVGQGEGLFNFQISFLVQVEGSGFQQRRTDGSAPRQPLRRGDAERNGEIRHTVFNFRSYQKSVTMGTLRSTPKTDRPKIMTAAVLAIALRVSAPLR